MDCKLFAPRAFYSDLVNELAARGRPRYPKTDFHKALRTAVERDDDRRRRAARAQQDAEQIYQIFAFPSLMSAMAAVTDKFSVGRNEPNSA
jgi:hypothetical protein